jgi:hypothetical protein
MTKSSHTQITEDLANAGVPEELADYIANITVQENLGIRQLSDRTPEEMLAIGVVTYLVSNS